MRVFTLEMTGDNLLWLIGELTFSARRNIHNYASPDFELSRKHWRDVAIRQYRMAKKLQEVYDSEDYKENYKFAK